MVRFTVLASGSKGNCTVVTGGRTRILVDAGLSCRELFRRMRLAGEDPQTLDAIVITHEHQDHINGLAITARKLGIPVYFTEATHRAWMRWLTPRRQMTYSQWLEQCRKQAAERQAGVPGDGSLSPGWEAGVPGDKDPSPGDEAEADCSQEGQLDEPGLGAGVGIEAQRGAEADGEIGLSAAAEARACSSTDVAKEVSTDVPSRKEYPTWLPAVEYFQAGHPFRIGDIDISSFTIPHDATDPVGFVFAAEGVRMGFATDLGYIPPNVKAQLKGVNLLLLESNHDLDMLRDGPYPWSVKQRVLSRVGHLSNEAAAEFLSTSYDGQAAYVILAHLSESNNLPELARVTADRALNGRATLLANHLLVAEQHQPMAAVHF